MHGYLIGEVCQTLDVKPHVLRYWEQQVPLLSPRKDHAGRRIYTARELQILFRLRYLIGNRRFTTEGAAKKIIDEVQGGGADLKAEVHSLRESLLALSRTTRNVGASAGRALAAELPDESCPVSAEIWSVLPVARRIAIASELSRWNGDPEVYAGSPVVTGSSAMRRNQAGAEAGTDRPAVVLPVYRWRNPELQRYFPGAANRLRFSAVVVADESDGQAEVRRAVLDTARQLENAGQFAMMVTSWVVAGSEAQLGDPAEMLRFCARTVPTPAPVNMVVTGSFPLRDADGRFAVSANLEGLASYSCGLLFLLRALVRDGKLLDGCDAVLLVRPRDRSAPVPLIHLLGWYDLRRCDAVAYAARDTDSTEARGYRRTGATVVSSTLIRNAVLAGAGCCDRVSHRLFTRSIDPDETVTESLNRFRIRPIDLLTRARRPRMFSRGEPA